MTTVAVVVADATDGDPIALVGAGDLLSRLGRTGAPPDVLVLQRPGGEEPESLAARLGDLDALSEITPVTDAVQRVDDAARLVDAVDRSRFGRLGAPQVLRADALRRALDGVDPDARVNPALLVLARGGRVRALSREAEGPAPSDPHPL